MNLEQRFLTYLQEGKVIEFTTHEAMQWYSLYYQGRKEPRYSDFYYLVLKPLRDKGFIKNVYRGNWVFLIQPHEEDLGLKDLKEENEKDEFFTYITQKLKG